MGSGARYVPHLLRYVLSLFWFDRVMDETRNVLPRNVCAQVYFVWMC